MRRKTGGKGVGVLKEDPSGYGREGGPGYRGDEGKRVFLSDSLMKHKSPMKNARRLLRGGLDCASAPLLFLLSSSVSSFFFSIFTHIPYFSSAHVLQSLPLKGLHCLPRTVVTRCELAPFR